MAGQQVKLKEKKAGPSLTHQMGPQATCKIKVALGLSKVPIGEAFCLVIGQEGSIQKGKRCIYFW